MKIDNPQEYVGKKYGHTTVLKFIGRYFNGECEFKCQCDCGVVFCYDLYGNNKIRPYCYSCMPEGHLVDYYGETYLLSHLANKLNLSRKTLTYRIKNWDMSRWAEPIKRRTNET